MLGFELCKPLASIGFCIIPVPLQTIGFAPGAASSSKSPPSRMAHSAHTAGKKWQVHEDTATAVHVPWFNLWEERSPPACNYAFDQIALGRVAPMMRYVNGFANVCEQVRECHSTL